MSEALNTATGIALQCLIFAGVIFAAIGLHNFFGTNHYVNWPWTRGQEAKLDEAQQIHRKGVAAAMFYYARAIEQHGIRNTNAVAEAFSLAHVEMLQQLAPDQRETFERGLTEGRLKMDDLLMQCRQEVLYRYIPDMQSILADTARLVGHCAANTTGDLVPAMAKIRDNIAKLQGLRV